jgi:hypothetical protein
MHRIFNLNKFLKNYQVFEKQFRTLHHEKKNSKIHKECLNNFFWPKIFTINTICVNVYKTYECDSNLMPYWNFGPSIKHGTHWINFIILTFINENNKYFRCLYKIWNKIISFDMRKKVKCKLDHGKSGKINKFGNL